MRKTIIIFFITGCIISLSFSLYYTYKVVRGQAFLPFQPTESKASVYRLVVISEEVDTPFWNKVKEGAESAAGKMHIDIEFLGSYRPNISELLKNMDLAIAAKVDGIIVQGVDTPQFSEKVMSAFEKGIPVVTIATDAPSSLRRTYVGSNNYEDGIMLGNYVKANLHGLEKVGVITGSELTGMQSLRRLGLVDALKSNSKVQIITSDTAKYEGASQETHNLLNAHPEVRVFVGLSADSGEGIAKAIRNRAEADIFSIYTFDETPEIVDLMQHGMIKATLQHQPGMMGEKSVQLIAQWLEGKDLPLPHNYFVPTRMVAQEKME